MHKRSKVPLSTSFHAVGSIAATMMDLMQGWGPCKLSWGTQACDLSARQSRCRIDFQLVAWYASVKLYSECAEVQSEAVM